MPSPFRTVVVGTDFSPPAEDAVRAASRLVAPGGELHIVYAVLSARDLAPGTPGAHVFVEALESDARDAEERLARLTKEGPDPAVRTHVVRGEPARALCREAEQLGADLVVVGSQGRGRFERALLGSTARGVARRAASSVLVVKRPVGASPGPPFPRIAVATDLFADAGPAAEVGRALADGREVALVHALDPAVWGSIQSTALLPGRGVARSVVEDAVSAALHRANVATFDGKAREVLRSGRAAGVVVDAAAELHADLLVVGSHRPGLVERIILGSVAEAVAERASCSVLVARATPLAGA